MERVEKAAEDYMRHHPYISSCDPDIERHVGDTLEYAVTVRHRLPIEHPPEDAPFEIGDTLHAFRVALDYLAFGTITDAFPSVPERQIAFPICEDAADWPSVLNGALNGVSGDLLTAFKSVQPCFRPDGTPPEHDPLAILNRLEKPHKHRRMLSALPGVYEVIPTIEGDPAHVAILHVTIPTAPFSEYEKCEVARFRVAVDDRLNPKAKVNTKVRFFVCFDRKGPAFGAPAITLLKKMRDRIRDDVFPAFKDFV